MQINKVGQRINFEVSQNDGKWIASFAEQADAEKFKAACAADASDRRQDSRAVELAKRLVQWYTATTDEAGEDHWSSPNGCHEDCPACKLENLASDDNLEEVIVLAKAIVAASKQ